MKKIFNISLLVILTISGLIFSNTTANAGTTRIAHQGSFTVTASVLNIRSAPTTSSSIVGTYYSGSRFNIDSLYYEETTIDGVSGYRVWGSYISYSGSRRYIAVQDFKMYPYKQWTTQYAKPDVFIRYL